MQYSVDKKGTKKSVKHWSDGGTYTLTKQTEVAFEGRCRVVTAADDFFGGDESKTYKGRILENPTWRQLFGEAKRSQRSTKDYHHDFFEGAIVVKTTQDGVKVLNLILGS